MSETSRINMMQINKNGWFFSTQDTVESRDVRRHLRFLLDIFKQLLIKYHRLSFFAYTGSNDKKAALHGKKAAQLGNAWGQNQYGNILVQGVGLPKNEHEAVKWYRQAAVQGFLWAEANLGWCYLEGIGVIQDYAQSFIWYKKAAEKGHAESQYNLGLAYIDGYGINQNQMEGKKWLILAEKQGITEASIVLKKLQTI